MSETTFRLCTYALNGFESVGLGVGPEPTEVVDVQRAFNHLRSTGRAATYLEWPTQLTMQQVLTNWDYFIERFQVLADLVAAGELGGAADSDFVHAVTDIRFAAPLVPPKILNAGANYYDHIKEMGTVEITPENDIPYIFPKTPNNGVIGDGQPVVLPKSKNWDVTQYVDWEAELAVVIGRTATDVSAEDAADYIAGYTIYQDISGRDKMIRDTGPFPWDWYANKCNDTFAPLGPWIVPAKFVPDPQNLTIKSIVNGNVEQDSNTSQMIWTAYEMVSYASEITTLQPGDVIGTGTCAGCGMAKGINVGVGNIADLFPNMYAGGGAFLKAGDVLVTEIEGLGRLTNPIVAG